MPSEDSQPERREDDIERSVRREDDIERSVRHEDDIERLVRRAVRDELSSLVGTILWTLLSGFALLVGFQLLQFWLLDPSGGVGLVMLAAGVLIVCSSLYLLYLLYRRTPMDT